MMQKVTHRLTRQSLERLRSPKNKKNMKFPNWPKVRLYALRGVGLTAMDMGWGGRPGKSDPYIRAHIGKAKFDDRARYIEDSVDPDFFRCIELDAELPGAPLVVEVMDYDG